ncbi:MAG: hypothetical protein HN764_10465 [Gammaproteobacteria bacterium]|jgi:hypothetical protein|nr:hypothetical protein [Gammaproteobacteria bacterium]
MQRNILFSILFSAMLGLLSIYPAFVSADGIPEFNGVWVINEELSDDTDKQVEKAIKDSGGKVGRTKKKGKGRYKGGPPEQAMYDHISYDEILHFQYQEPEFRLTYAEGFERIFHSDNRRRSASARGSSRSERKDFAFASWSSTNKLFVESRPRDGGRTSEVYTLIKSDSGKDLLQVELNLNPLMFSGPLYIKRVYNREGEFVPSKRRR